MKQIVSMPKREDRQLIWKIHIDLSLMLCLNSSVIAITGRGKKGLKGEVQ